MLRSPFCLFVAALVSGCATPPTPVADATQNSAAAPSLAAFEINELDKTPAPKFQARPTYPAKFAQAKVSGSAVVDFVVTANGDVIRARAIRATHLEFGEAAVAAVQRWKFTPGQKNGRPVATHMQVPINFEMDGPRSATAVGAARLEATRPVTLQAIDIGQLDVKPIARFQARPLYPAHLREERVHGEAVIDFIVDLSGDVRNASVLRTTHPEFGDAALDAVAQWKFKPGMLRGRAVNTHMQVPIVFTLNNR